MMIAYIIRRVMQTIMVVLIVTVLVFVLMHSVPGDPITLFLGPDATAEQITHYKEVYGLDQPLVIQYFKWLGNAVKGDFGRSILLRKDIGPVLVTKIKVTLTIAIPTFIISTIVGILLGMIAAIKRGKVLDSVITVLANVGMAAPVFWLSILCVYIFSIKLGWLPVQGFTFPSDDFALAIRKMIMPVFILGLGPIAVFARQTRSAMLEVIRQDYIRTGRSKGLKEHTIIFKHALRNAMIPIVTLMGMQLGRLIGGTVLIEQVFVIPGMGNLLMTGILQKDYLLVQGTILVIAASISLCNLVVDIAYGWIDPRIRIN